MKKNNYSIYTKLTRSQFVDGDDEPYAGDVEENLTVEYDGKKYTTVKNNMRNLLENVTLGRHKILRSIKNDMIHNGAIATMMSGSGPTIFGICEDSLSAQKLYDFFKGKFNDVYITRTINPN